MNNQLFDPDLGMQKQIAELKDFLASALGEDPLDTPLLQGTRSAFYHNGRERGFYLGLMIGSDEKGPLTCENLVFFEHRNSDDIILLRWQTHEVKHKYDFKHGGYEPVTVSDIPEDIYPDKYHYTKSWGYWDFKSVALYVRNIYVINGE